MDIQLREILYEPVLGFIENFIGYIPNLIGALVVLLIGWLLAKLLSIISEKFVLALHLEKMAEKFKMMEILKQGDIRHSIAEQFGRFVFWVVIIITIGISSNILHWDLLSNSITSVLSYIPKFILAVLIIIIAGFLGSFVGGYVRMQTSNLKRVNSYIAGNIAKYVIIGIAIVMALERLDISTPFFIISTSIILFGVVLAFAIATGLALKDRVSEIIRTSIGEEKQIVLDEDEDKKIE
jgi:hypothetical protein